MTSEQLPISFAEPPPAGASVLDDQLELFDPWVPNIDVHLHSPTVAVASIAGPDPERAVPWLRKAVGDVTETGRARRVLFPTRTLDRLLCVVRPSNVTLDASAVAVAKALWAHALGHRPIRVRKDGRRLLGSSWGWPAELAVRDAPWPAIAALATLDVPLRIDPEAQALLASRLARTGHTLARGGLMGSSVLLETSRPELLEASGLPALSYAGEPGSGRYKVPLLAAEPLLSMPEIELSKEVAAAIRKASRAPRKVKNTDRFPYTLYSFQAKDLARAVHVIDHTGGVLLAGEMGSGKAAPVDARVVTPGGLRPIGDLQVGDEVFGSDGRPHRVVGVFPQGTLPMFDVHFSDGAVVRASADHRWLVNSALRKYRGNPPRVKTTEEIAGSLRDKAGNAKHYIGLVEPLEFPEQDLPIDPYLLGVLLGDGSTSNTVSLISGDSEFSTILEPLLPDGVQMRVVMHPGREYVPAGEADVPATEAELLTQLDIDDVAELGGKQAWAWVFRRTDKGPNPLASALRELGLMGVVREGKFVPAEYLYASVAQRHALLQGLLDTDGGVKNAKQRSSIEFSNCSEHLVDAVVWLTESLGGTARKSAPRYTTYTHNGVKKRTTRPSWRVCVQLPNRFAPFRLPRKASYHQPRGKYPPTRAITDIVPAGEEEAVCIMVDAPDHQFVLDRCVLTMNTTVSLGLVDHKHLWPLLVVCPLAAFSTWERQLAEMGVDAYICTDPVPVAKDKLMSRPWEAVVISFDRLPRFMDEISQFGFAAVIGDEAQRIRNAGSKRSRALRSLAASIPYRIGLSGTPVTNSALDTLALAAFMQPSDWKPRLSSSDLAEMYPGDDPIESLAEHLGTMMVRRRMEDTGVKLPGREVKRVFVPLTVEQRRALEDLIDEARRAKEEGELGSHMHVFARLQKMRQVQNCPAVAGVAGPNPKVVAAIEIAAEFAEQDMKSIIFVADRAAYIEVGERLDAAGLGWVGIWGSTPIEERISNERRYHEDPDVKVFVGTLAACAESLTLSPTARCTIFAALSYSPSAIAQAAARAYRMNTTDEVTEVYLCAKGPVPTLDDRIWELLTIKRALFAKIVDRTDYADDAETLSFDDLVYLLTGERDEQAELFAQDRAAEEGRWRARKDHARATAHRRKGKNRDVVVDDGSVAEVLERWDDDDVVSDEELAVMEQLADSETDLTFDEVAESADDQFTAA